MREPASSPPRRVPRLSIPGGLLLGLCLFLPAVEGCEKPVYPYEIPQVYGPYLFGLLVALLAWLPAGKKTQLLRFAAWTVGTVSAVGGILNLINSMIGPDVKYRHFLWAELLFWTPLLVALAGSVRHHRDPRRWHSELLWSGGGLALVFFSQFVVTGTTYFGLWLSILATLLLISEGLWTASTLRTGRVAGVLPSG